MDILHGNVCTFFPIARPGLTRCLRMSYSAGVYFGGRKQLLRRQSAGSRAERRQPNPLGPAVDGHRGLWRAALLADPLQQHSLSAALLKQQGRGHLVEWQSRLHYMVSKAGCLLASGRANLYDSVISWISLQVWAQPSLHPRHSVHPLHADVGGPAAQRVDPRVIPHRLEQPQCAHPALLAAGVMRGT